jgi:hypothetical protein
MGVGASARDGGAAGLLAGRRGQPGDGHAARLGVAVEVYDRVLAIQLDDAAQRVGRYI